MEPNSPVAIIGILCILVSISTHVHLELWTGIDKNLNTLHLYFLITAVTVEDKEYT